MYKELASFLKEEVLEMIDYYRYEGVPDKVIAELIDLEIREFENLSGGNCDFKKTKELEKYSELLETGTATEYVDIKESDGLISMAYLYQDKELIERHGIGVIIGKQYYRIGIAPEIGTTLNKN